MTSVSKLVRLGPYGLSVFLVLLGILSSCGTLKEYIENGYSLEKDYSVFARFSGSYCSLVSATTGAKLSVNCENIRSMVDLNSEFCKEHSGESWKAFFPDQSSPMNLCQDKGFPGRSEKQAVRVLVFGDSGAGDDEVKGERQTLVAEAMARVCPYRSDLGADVSQDKSQRGCDFAVVVGDIIYPDGTPTVFASELNARFEEPYKRHGGLPFYIAPGNHDYHGNVTAMVEYNWFSNRWHMPGRFYPVPDLPSWLNIFAIDSIAFTGDDGVKNNFSEQMGAMSESFCDKSGWKIILGHYPPLSHGMHGQHEDQARALAETYKTCPFHLYLSGHDHNLEFLTTSQYNILVSGGGGAVVKQVEVLPEGTVYSAPEYGLEAIQQKYVKSAHGFSVLEISESSLDVYYFDINKWNPQKGAFGVTPSFEQHDFHCRSTIDAPLVCN